MKGEARNKDSGKISYPGGSQFRFFFITAFCRICKVEKLFQNHAAKVAEPSNFSRSRLQLPPRQSSLPDQLCKSRHIDLLFHIHFAKVAERFWITRRLLQKLHRRSSVPDRPGGSCSANLFPPTVFAKVAASF